MEQKQCSKCGEWKLLSEFYHHRAQCKACYIASRKVYYQSHQEERQDYQRAKDTADYKEQWVAENQQHVTEYNRIYRNTRYATDLNFRLTQLIRARIRLAIKKGRPDSSIQALGCSIEQLKIHLESQFLPGMSWNNHGEWHIDHIKGLASFDLTDPVQFSEACHYSNLQPLWAKDNLSKG